MSSLQLRTGILVVVGVVMQTLWMGPAVALLDAGLIVSWLVWTLRLLPSAAGRARLVMPYCVALVVQSLHLLEEASFGFQRQFPALVGAEPWSDARFLAFNLTWLAVMAVAAWRLRGGSPAWVVVVWFVALVGGVGNGIAHGGFALVTGGYFPGLATAPLQLIVGGVLLHRLVTADSAAEPRAAREADG